MRVESTSIPGVLLIEPLVYADERGFVFETFQAARYCEAGLTLPFVQDNVSMTRRGVVRGLHLQHPHAQGKLVWVLQGEVYDVAVDVRVGSPTFGKWVAVVLSGENHRQLYIPPGFAHGFCATSDIALFSYKCTERYHPEDELGVAFDDPALAIPWPVASPQVNARDRANLRLAQLEGRLPRYLLS